MVGLVRYFLSKVNSRAVFASRDFDGQFARAFLIGYFYNHVQDKQLYTILVTGFFARLDDLSTFNAELVGLFPIRRNSSIILILTYSLDF